ncbi:hypothetical protein [Caballeronia sp.]|uniref:hypothetical protein n=1 Tax=Caballeronia sp. TaxID=1931223 RepID=UPI003C31D937
MSELQSVARPILVKLIYAAALFWNAIDLDWAWVQYGPNTSEAVRFGKAPLGQWISLTSLRLRKKQFVGSLQHGVHRALSAERTTVNNDSTDL